MFFTASILIGLGCIAIAVFVIVINNLIARYWKSLDWFKSWNFTQQNDSQGSRREPQIDPKK